MLERDFKGIWIPKEIWLDTRLNALEKIILAEIDSLDNGVKGCYASNEYLANFCQCSQSKVSSAVTKLSKLGYIYTKIFDGRSRELKSRLLNFSRQTNKICKADYENLEHNNIVNNNIVNNNIYSQDIVEIIDYLNKKANVHYRDNTPKTRELIMARLKEHFTVEDFKRCIDNMVSEWKGTEFEQYLRPQTLFGNKFESYVNRAMKKKTNETSFDIDYYENHSSID